MVACCSLQIYAPDPRICEWSYWWEWNSLRQIIRVQRWDERVEAGKEKSGAEPLFVDLAKQGKISDMMETLNSLPGALFPSSCSVSSTDECLCADLPLARGKTLLVSWWRSYRVHMHNFSSRHDHVIHSGMGSEADLIPVPHVQLYSRFMHRLADAYSRLGDEQMVLAWLAQLRILQGAINTRIILMNEVAFPCWLHVLGGIPHTYMINVCIHTRMRAGTFLQIRMLLVCGSLAERMTDASQFAITNACGFGVACDIPCPKPLGQLCYRMVFTRILKSSWALQGNSGEDSYEGNAVEMLGKS